MCNWIPDELHELLNIVGNMFHTLLHVRASELNRLDLLTAACEIIGIPFQKKLAKLTAAQAQAGPVEVHAL